MRQVVGHPAGGIERGGVEILSHAYEPRASRASTMAMAPHPSRPPAVGRAVADPGRAGHGTETVRNGLDRAPTAPGIPRPGGQTADRLAWLIGRLSPGHAAATPAAARLRRSPAPPAPAPPGPASDSGPSPTNAAAWPHRAPRRRATSTPPGRVEPVGRRRSRAAPRSGRPPPARTHDPAYPGPDQRSQRGGDDAAGGHQASTGHPESFDLLRGTAAAMPTLRPAVEREPGVRIAHQPRRGDVPDLVPRDHRDRHQHSCDSPISTRLHIGRRLGQPCSPRRGGSPMPGGSSSPQNCP